MDVDNTARRKGKFERKQDTDREEGRWKTFSEVQFGITYKHLSRYLLTHSSSVPLLKFSSEIELYIPFPLCDVSSFPSLKFTNLLAGASISYLTVVRDVCRGRWIKKFSSEKKRNR